jgi:hypothetical protein
VPFHILTGKIPGNVDFSSKILQFYLSTGVKKLGSEADHSPPSSVKLKNVWIYTLTIPYASGKAAAPQKV